MKEQTVLQELIEMSNKLEFHHWFNTHKERLLQKEKEQITTAYDDGNFNAFAIVGRQKPTCQNSNDYFNNKYN